MDAIIEDESPRARLALLLEHFSELDDDREAWRVLYPIEEVLLLVTCATIASCDDFDDIADWGEHHLDFLRRFSDFHHGVPCARWLRDLVNRIDPALFRRCFESWVAALWPDRHEFIAIDGKTARRTHDHRKGLKALHTLSAYATTARLTLAQLSVPEKTNEIAAIPELLDQLAEAGQLEGAMVTIDAMGCQVEIADKIVAHKADYLLALKGNQPTLEADVVDYFRTAPAAELVTKTTVERAHGRIATRTYTASKIVDWIVSERSYPGQPRFTAIKTVVKVDTRTEQPTARPSTPVPTSPPSGSTSNASPRAFAAIGGWRACIGCSMSSSRTICRAIAAVTAPKTWPLSAALLSISSVITNPRAASRHDENAQHGTATSCSRSCKSTVNLDSLPWVFCTHRRSALAGSLLLQQQPAFAGFFIL
jgi:predicted transposase YbfD/YdcC